MFITELVVPMIFFHDFLDCASLKNYRKKAWEISPDPQNMIGVFVVLGRYNFAKNLRLKCAVN